MHDLTRVQFDSFDSLGFTSNSTAQREEFVRTGRMQEWLAADKRAQWGNEYITNSTREQRKTIVQAQGGLEAHLKWYRSFVEGINSADEKGKIYSNQTFVSVCQLLMCCRRE